MNLLNDILVTIRLYFVSIFNRKVCDKNINTKVYIYSFWAYNIQLEINEKVKVDLLLEKGICQSFPYKYVSACISI